MLKYCYNFFQKKSSENFPHGLLPDPFILFQNKKDSNMKANMIFYIAAVISFYLSIAIQFLAGINVLGIALVCMGLLSLLIGLICQLAEGKHSRTANLETAAASPSMM